MNQSLQSVIEAVNACQEMQHALVNAKWGDNDLKMADAVYDSAEELLRAAGAEVLPYRRNAPPPPGDSTHEVGTARMGDDPKRAVLNRFNQAHDVKNLFVVDGSSFVSSGCHTARTIRPSTRRSWRAPCP